MKGRFRKSPGRREGKGIEDGRRPFFARGEFPLEDLLHDLAFKYRVGEGGAQDVASEDLPLRRDDELNRDRAFDIRLLPKPSAVKLKELLFILICNLRNGRVIELDP